MWVDCDVLQADGGTRTAAITGACVAVALAGEKAPRDKLIKKLPIKSYVAAVSVGLVAGEALLDLCYAEDKDATVDMNVVMTDAGRFVEVQGAGEEATFADDELTQMLALARNGISELIAAQRAIVEAAP
jgi:ribonuclease PH